jgi:hypothetical protein
VRSGRARLTPAFNCIRRFGAEQARNSLAANSIARLREPSGDHCGLRATAGRGPSGRPPRPLRCGPDAGAACAGGRLLWHQPERCNRRQPGLQAVRSARLHLSDHPRLSGRALCHALSCLAARGGRLHCRDDAQAERREADVRRRAAAFVGHRAAGSPRKQPPAGRPADCPFRIDPAMRPRASTQLVDPSLNETPAGSRPSRTRRPPVVPLSDPLVRTAAPADGGHGKLPIGGH